MQRCDWCLLNERLQIYHDTEWGVPLHDDHKHFEFLLLDGFQAGLSWNIILQKREHFRKVFSNFDPQKISRYKEEKIDGLLNDRGIIRNRLKILAAVSNAKAFLQVQREEGSFDRFIWQFTQGRTKHNQYRTMQEIPATSKESDAMSRELKRRGFKFVGSTICYAYMQAAGMVNDHLVGCFRYREIKK